MFVEGVEDENEVGRTLFENIRTTFHTDTADTER